MKQEALQPLESSSLPFDTYSISLDREDMILGVCFLCRCINDSEMLSEGDEHDEIKWVPVRDIEEYDLIPGLKGRFRRGYFIFLSLFGGR